jgi:hypothetical protein
MWTNKNRARYDRSKLRYPSDLTDDEWELGVDPEGGTLARKALVAPLARARRPALRDRQG